MWTWGSTSPSHEPTVEVDLLGGSRRVLAGAATAGDALATDHHIGRVQLPGGRAHNHAAPQHHASRLVPHRDPHQAGPIDRCS